MVYGCSIGTLLTLNGCDFIPTEKDNKPTVEEKKDITYQKFENISATMTKAILNSIAIGETKEILDVRNASIIVDGHNHKTYSFLGPYNFKGEAKETDSVEGKHYTELTVDDYNAFIDILVSKEVNTRKLLIKRIEESRYFIQYLVPEKDEKLLSSTQTLKYKVSNGEVMLTHAINTYPLI
ncbi:hypothetical protein SIM22_06285 [Bacillus cereus group sp. BfR-BA-01363]|uniref:hypothetical protein n=1 Tax=Bacillus cereus group sp. BfR-BA-01363 TaxID=3094882 RepID=UPI0029C5F854|nr:hypothetical protein [Bacillus cereus group sp. BfR-BA-01363]MDX5853713.1 hypothetical protein [Bacillus cereus group sp. BfR-BA-01363]